jgi:dTDP-4-dehydrorhamnose reductase
MIYILGIKGKIASNLSVFLTEKEIKFIGVSRKESNNNISFNSFLRNISKEQNCLVINAANLSIEDFETFVKSIKKNKYARIIHISSVSVYGNSNNSNQILPINNYGLLNLKKENYLKKINRVLILRLSNVYGGFPETSPILNLYNSGKLKFIEVDNNNNELIRDFISINILLLSIYKNLNFGKSNILNISSGNGTKISDFLKLQNINILNIRRKVYNKNETIKISIIDKNYNL